MSLLARQQQLVERYGILPGPQERLNALVDRCLKLPPLAEELKSEGNRIQGCQSRAYVVGRMEAGACHFACDADSVMVKALIASLCELYSGNPPREIWEVEPEFLTKLGVWQILSSTRQEGLTQVRAHIKGWAGQHLA